MDVFIVNPAAGDGRFRDQVSELPRRFPGAEVRATERPGHAEEIARDLADEEGTTTVVAGGDGTIHEVLNGLLAAERRPQRLAVLPLGTGNDLCRTLGLAGEMEAVLDVLRAGRTAVVDVGLVRADGSSRYFLNVSGGGFAAEVSDRLDSDRKTTWGQLAYFWTALEALLELREYEAELTFADGERLLTTIANLFIANGCWVAGGIPVAPTARLDDGLLDVVVVESDNVAQLTAIAAKMTLGQHLGDPGIVHRQTSRLTITCPEDMTFNLDGEVFEAPPLSFEIEPRALEITVGPSAPGLGE